MKPCFLLTLCASLATCAGVQPQPAASPPAAPARETPPPVVRVLYTAPALSSSPEPATERGTPPPQVRILSAPSALPPLPTVTTATDCPKCCPLEMEPEAPGRLWARTEYLMWWMRGAAPPPLVTVSPANTP